jgi:hypothetical protein
VQHAGDADAGAEMLGVGCDGERGLGRGLEQEIIDCCLVLVGDIGDRCGERIEDVKILRRNQLGLALGEPPLCGRTLALRAMPVATRVVSDDGVGAVLAARHMPTERRRTAALDRTHHRHLVDADVPGIGSAPREAMVAENIRDLQQWTRHGRRYGAGGWSLRLFLGFLRGRDNRSRGLSMPAIMPVATRA